MPRRAPTGSVDTSAMGASARRSNPQLPKSDALEPVAVVAAVRGPVNRRTGLEPEKLSEHRILAREDARRERLAVEVVHALDPLLAEVGEDRASRRVRCVP